MTRPTEDEIKATLDGLKEMVRSPDLSVEWSPRLMAAIRVINRLSEPSWVPEGHILPRGQVMSRADYPELFDAFSGIPKEAAWKRLVRRLLDGPPIKIADLRRRS